MIYPWLLLTGLAVVFLAAAILYHCQLTNAIDLLGRVSARREMYRHALLRISACADPTLMRDIADHALRDEETGAGQ